MTDKEILRLLMENARRPYNEIAEQVNPSPPTVSNRIDRLRERGLIRRFTLDIDRSMLREGDSVFVELRVQPGPQTRSSIYLKIALVSSIFSSWLIPGFYSIRI